MSSVAEAIFLGISTFPSESFIFDIYLQADMVIKSALKLMSDAYAPHILSLSTFKSGTWVEEPSGDSLVP